jgi:hypothetical protein
MSDELAYPELLGDLMAGKPSTARLFTAVAGEALACLFRAGWDIRIRRMENILSVIKRRMELHRISWELSPEKVREAGR